MKDIKFLSSSDGNFFGDNNDILFDVNNDIVTIDGTTRIKQSLVKIFLTKLGSSDIYQGYGSDLQNLIFSSAVDPNASDAIKNIVIETLTYFINIEPSDVPSEKIIQVTALDVIPVSNGNLTQFFVRINLLLENNQSISLTLGD